MKQIIIPTVMAAGSDMTDGGRGLRANSEKDLCLWWGHVIGSLHNLAGLCQSHKHPTPVKLPRNRALELPISYSRSVCCTSYSIHYSPLPISWHDELDRRPAAASSHPLRPVDQSSEAEFCQVETPEGHGHFPALSVSQLS